MPEYCYTTILTLEVRTRADPVPEAYESITQSIRNF